MRCSGCGRENREGRRFCGGCRGALAPVCAGCGAQNDPGDQFCGECGGSLGAAPAQAGSRAASSASAGMPTRSLGDIRFGEVRKVALKGIAEPQELTLIDWS